MNTNLKVNAAIRNLRAKNPGANWKNVNGTNLTNGQKKVLTGLKLGNTAQAPRQALTQAQVQAPKRNLKEIYEFPKEGTLKERIEAVSRDVWKHFESKGPADEIAWLVLKSQGQTVNHTPYVSGFIMDQYDWKKLYDEIKGGSTPMKYKQIMRYILVMLARNPPYTNRKRGNRNRLIGQTRIGTMNNKSFDEYLKATVPIANQGGGYGTALVRTLASTGTLVKKKVIEHQDVIVNYAMTAALAKAQGQDPGSAVMKKATQNTRSALIGAAKSAVGNNPVLSALINRGANAAANAATARLTHMLTTPKPNTIKKVIAEEANKMLGLPPPTPVAPAAPSVNTAYINSTAAQYRTRIYTNIGPYAGNEYGTRNARANKGAAAIKQYLKNAAAAGKNIKTNSTVKQDVQGLYRMAVYPRPNRPPLLSNMAWTVALGAGIVALAGVGSYYFMGGAAGGFAAKKATNVVFNKATQFARKQAEKAAANLALKKAANLARQQAAKKAANWARQQAAKKAVQTAKGMAQSRAKQAVLQGVAKKGARTVAETLAKRSGINQAHLKFIKSLLNRARKGDHTITSNMINKAVQRAAAMGLNSSGLMVALEKGGQQAQYFLSTLA